MNLVAVDIHGHRVLRHVGVVEAITADVLPLHPVCQPLAILAQPVGEHAGALGQGRLPGSRRGAARPGTGPGRGCAQLIGSQVEQQQMRGDGAVPQGIALVAAQARGFAQVQVRGQQRRLPAAELGRHQFPQLAIQVRQAGLFPQSLAVGRVAHQQPERHGRMRGLFQF